MSLRQGVSRERIAAFLQHTLDVDLVIEVSADGHSELIRVLQEIRLALDINIEEASPGDFIPLPAGFSDRHVFIGRYGQVEAFHFDWYCTALSKIERGRQQDLADVIALLSHHRIDWIRLEGMYREILPLMGQKSLRQKPGDFARNFVALESLWRSAGGTL